MKTNIKIHNMLKTLSFTLENGKSLSSALELLSRTTSNAKDKKTYLTIYNDVKDGIRFSLSLKKHKVGSLDIIQFISLAEKGISFKQALKNIIEYIELKDTFERETNEKTTLPFLYFILAVVVVVGVKFIAIPHQISQTEGYSKEIMDLITNHLFIAQVMTDILFIITVLFSCYLMLLILALFGGSYTTQALAKYIGLFVPFISQIIIKFEKFMIFSMLGKMLQSGISYKNVIVSAIQTTTIQSHKKAFQNTLDTIKYKGQFVFSNVLYDDLERELMLGVGSSQQIGKVMLEISSRARADALELSMKFFRMITVMALFLLSFAVIVEFWTVVLTQVLIQKGMIDMARSAGAG